MAGTHDIARDVGMKDTQVKAVFNAILARLKNGERVLIKDHGTYEVKHVKERMIKSPQIPNGEAKVEAHDVIKYRPSPATKAVLNGQAELPSVTEEETAPAPAPAPKAAPAKPAVPKAAAAPAKPAPAKPAAPAAAKPAPAKAAAPAAKPAAPAAKKPAPKPAPVVEETEATE